MRLRYTRNQVYEMLHNTHRAWDQHRYSEQAIYRKQDREAEKEMRNRPIIRRLHLPHEILYLKM